MRAAFRGWRQGRENAHGGEAAGGADSGGREAGIRMGWLGRGPAQQKFEELLFDGGLGSRRRGRWGSRRWGRRSSAAAQGWGGVGRAGLVANDLHDFTSRLEAVRSGCDEFESREIQSARTP